MTSVDTMIADIIRIEGGYVNHPADRGGKTKYGITERVARAFGYNGRMRDLPKSKAHEIYKMRYYLRPGFDRVAHHSVNVAEKMFDMGVNMGPAVPAKFLQRILNVLNRGGRDYRDIPVDGGIGPLTIHALKAYLARRGMHEGTHVLLKALNALQGAKYIAIAERNPSQEAFMHGWLSHRLSDLHA